LLAEPASVTMATRGGREPSPEDWTFFLYSTAQHSTAQHSTAHNEPISVRV
jgi:hypothetical protein